jgi:hypothetical protein
MRNTHIRLPGGSLSPFGPSVALDRAVIASALTANPRAGEALALAANAMLYFRKHRAELLAFAEVVTDLADLVDGDPDFEDATDLEDDHSISSLALNFTSGPGCAVSDVGEHDGCQCDSSYFEWQSRGRHKLTSGAWEPFDRTGEDTEEDDPSGQCDEDGINTALGWAAHGGGAGCPISDPGGCEHDGREPDAE